MFQSSLHVVIVEDHGRRHRRQQPADVRVRPRLAIEPRVLLEVGDLLAGRFAHVAPRADECCRLRRNAVCVHLVAEEQEPVWPLRPRPRWSCREYDPERVDAEPFAWSACDSEYGGRWGAPTRHEPKTRRACRSPSRVRIAGRGRPSSGGHTRRPSRPHFVRGDACRLEILDEHERVVMSLDLKRPVLDAREPSPRRRRSSRPTPSPSSFRHTGATVRRGDPHLPKRRTGARGCVGRSEGAWRGTAKRNAAGQAASSLQLLPLARRAKCLHIEALAPCSSRRSLIRFPIACPIRPSTQGTTAPPRVPPAVPATRTSDFVEATRTSACAEMSRAALMSSAEEPAPGQRFCELQPKGTLVLALWRSRRPGALPLHRVTSPSRLSQPLPLQSGIDQYVPRWSPRRTGSRISTHA